MLRRPAAAGELAFLAFRTYRGCLEVGLIVWEPLRRPQRGVARRTKPLKCWESTLGFLRVLGSASGVLLGSAAWLRTLTTHYAAALPRDGAYQDDERRSTRRRNVALAAA